MAQVLKILETMRIIHGNLRPENVIVQYSDDELFDVKVKGFHKAVTFDGVNTIQANEYMPPEVHKQEIKKPQAVDIWSLGVMLLEIATGFPICAPADSRIKTLDLRQFSGQGLFVSEDLVQAQKAVSQSLKETIKKFQNYGLAQDAAFMDLLSKMLETNARRRISAEEILKHQYC